MCSGCLSASQGDSVEVEPKWAFRRGEEIAGLSRLWPDSGGLSSLCREGRVAATKFTAELLKVGGHQPHQ